MNQQVTKNRLVIHFDIDHVIKLPSHNNRNLYIHELCSKYIWGALQKNSSQQVTSWKITHDFLSIQQPQPQLVTYHHYLSNHLKPSDQQIQNLLSNMINSACSAIKDEVQKCLKYTTLSQVLHEAVKDSENIQSEIAKNYKQTGHYQILPAFFKLLLWLKKSKRQFAICLRTADKQMNHQSIIDELNLFFEGNHPLYNGQNGTPLVKMDGNHDTKNFVFFDSHYLIVYNFEEGGEFIGSFGTQQYVVENDPEMLKQFLKSKKRVKVCESIQEIYKYFHQILDEGAFVYSLNPCQNIFMDTTKDNLHQVYFSSEAEPKMCDLKGQKIEKTENYLQNVKEIELVKDINYFIKKVQEKEQNKMKELMQSQKQQNKQQQKQEELTQTQQNVKKQTDVEYLRKNITPLLQGALKQVDLLRPQDPIAFISLYFLKNKQRIQ